MRENFMFKGRPGIPAIKGLPQHQWQIHSLAGAPDGVPAMLGG